MTETLNKWDIFGSDEVGWEPHTLQEDILSSPARFRVACAGRRFGKSQIGGYELLPEAFVTYSQKESLLTAARRREFWIVGPAYQDSEKEFRVIYNLMKKIGMPFDRPGTYYDAVGGSMHISAFEGTFQVHAKSAQHPDSLVGEGLTGVVLAEAAKLKERVWTKAIRPTLADFGGWMLATSCLVGETLVQTENGLVHIEEMSRIREAGAYDDLGIRVSGFHGPPQVASKFYCNGMAETRKIRCTNGHRIEATLNHRVWSMNEEGVPGWRYVQDVHPGDYVAIRAGAELWGSEDGSGFTPEPRGQGRWKDPFDVTLDEDMAYFFGLMIGDGSYRGLPKGLLHLSAGIDPEIWEFCENWGMNSATYPSQLKAGKRGRKYCFARSELSQFMYYMGFRSGTSAEREIPARVRAMPRHLMVQLLAGLWDSDGARNGKSGGGLWYSSISLKLVSQIQSLLLNMGINSSLSIHERPEGSREQTGYRLTLTSRDSNTLLDNIPIRIARKAKRYEVSSKEVSNSRPPLQEDRIARVRKRYNMRGKCRDQGFSGHPWLGQQKNPGIHQIKSYLDFVLSKFPAAIEDQDVQLLLGLCEEGYLWKRVEEVQGGKAETFDLCVPTTHAYTANGIISHNTPEGRNWYHDMYQAGQDPHNPDWASWRCPSWGNHHVYKTPTLTRDVTRLQTMLESPKNHDNALQLVKKFNLRIDPEIVSLIMDLTPESFNQEIAAKFTDFVGRVFKDFDEEIHVGDFDFEPGWETYGAVDWGFTNPSVWLLIQVGTWGQIRVLDELYKPGLTPEEFSKEVLARGLCPRGLKTFYADPASPGDTRVMENILKVSSTGGTGGDLNPRLDAIRKALKPRQDKVPQLMLDRRCANGIREFGAYRYPDIRGEADKNSPELPLKKDDHFPEALSRFFAGKILTPQRQASRARTRSGYTHNKNSGLWTKR